MIRYEDIAEALTSYLPEANLGLVQRAYLYSSKVHAGQTRKSGEPYLVHPLEVAYLLTELRLDEESIVTGLLHDTVEDTLASPEDIKNMFGAEVASMVDGVTKLSLIRFDTDEHKQAENFRKMLVAMAKDIRVILVKLADRLHNMRTLHHLPEKKQTRVAQETMDIYGPLANRLGIDWVKSELEDLAFQYLHPLEHAPLKRKVEELTGNRSAYVDKVVDILQDELKTRGMVPDVYGRPKHLYSIFKKMTKTGIELEQVYDVIAFRVLVDSVGQCYEALGHIHAMWPPIPGRFKDYIAMPKPNQYRSLHTSVIGPEGERVEVQIRTHEMHAICEGGVAAHWDYKEAGKLTERNKQQFAWLRQLMEWQQDVKDPDEFLDIVKYDLFTDEVFVFTPRGEVVSLRRGATPVDFAFSIHTDVGLRCGGAKVNGRMVPLRYELKNGDMVEIITNTHQQPSRDWLKFVSTGRARQKIRTAIRTEEREQSRTYGREMLERDLRKAGISLNKLIKSGGLDSYIETCRYDNFDGLLVGIGYGQVKTVDIIRALDPKSEKPAAPAEVEPIRKVTRKSQRRSSSGVVVDGLGDILVRFGKCCNPLPGDSIVGFVSRGRGITVHTNVCTRGMDMDPERRVNLQWDDASQVLRPVTILVTTEDRPGLLASMSQIFTEDGVNISEANCKVVGHGKAVNTFEVLIQDKDQLRKVLGKIRSIKGVLTVDRG